jgi:ABC-type sugar transport system permease subunit
MNNKINKNRSNNLLITFLVLFGVIILIIIFIQIYYKFTNIDNSESKMKEYDVIMPPIRGDAKNMNNCPKGCIRGACAKKNGGCNYDFQCQYCNDEKTNMFFVDMNDERKIIPLYEEEEKLNSNQKNRLNQDIAKNNQYIDILNKKIMMMNS